MTDNKKILSNETSWILKYLQVDGSTGVTCTLDKPEMISNK